MECQIYLSIPERKRRMWAGAIGNIGIISIIGDSLYYLYYLSAIEACAAGELVRLADADKQKKQRRKIFAARFLLGYQDSNLE